MILFKNLYLWNWMDIWIFLYVFRSTPLLCYALVAPFRINTRFCPPCWYSSMIFWSTRHFPDGERKPQIRRMRINVSASFTVDFGRFLREIPFQSKRVIIPPPKKKTLNPHWKRLRMWDHCQQAGTIYVLSNMFYLESRWFASQGETSPKNYTPEFTNGWRDPKWWGLVKVTIP